MNTTTVELPDEIYVRLESQAKARGLTITQVIMQYMEAEERIRNAASIERLQMKGLLLVPTDPVPPVSTHVKPLQVQGQPLSEAIIEKRR
jgi:predicted DNA-binding ribbon-helix-helix protein